MYQNGPIYICFELFCALSNYIVPLLLLCSKFKSVLNIDENFLCIIVLLNKFVSLMILLMLFFEKFWATVKQKRNSQFFHKVLKSFGSLLICNGKRCSRYVSYSHEKVDKPCKHFEITLFLQRYCHTSCVRPNCRIATEIKKVQQVQFNIFRCTASQNQVNFSSALHYSVKICPQHKFLIKRESFRRPGSTNAVLDSQWQSVMQDPNS